MIGLVKNAYRLLVANVIGCASFMLVRRTITPHVADDVRGHGTRTADDERTETTSNEAHRDSGESSEIDVKSDPVPETSEDATQKLVRTLRDLNENLTREKLDLQNENRSLKVQRDENAIAIDNQSYEIEQLKRALDSSVTSRNELERFSEEVRSLLAAAGDSKTDELRCAGQTDTRKAPAETVDASAQTESPSVRDNCTAMTTTSFSTDSQTSVSFSKHYNDQEDQLFDIDFGSTDSFETGGDLERESNDSSTTAESSESLLSSSYGVDGGTTCGSVETLTDYLPVAEIVVELSAKFEHEITAKTYRRSINTVLLKIEASGFKSLTFQELAFLHKQVIQHSPKHFEKYKTLVEIAARNLPNWKRTTIKEKHDIIHIFATLDAVLKRKNKTMAKQKIDFAESKSEHEKALEEEIKKRSEMEEKLLRLEEESHRYIEMMPEWAIYSQSGNVLDRIESMTFELQRVNSQLE